MTPEAIAFALEMGVVAYWLLALTVIATELLKDAEESHG